MAKDKFTFLWKPWASLQAYYAAIFVMMGAVVSIWYPSQLIAGGNLLTSLIIIALEHPFPYMDKLGFVSNNYYLRALLYAAFVAPGLLQAATHTGSLCLVCAVLTYAWAAICGETGAAAAAPTRANPR
ncbi:hypothetical protein BASA50_011333 [Batrachochytrium salamandrivorans]|nr:hypothetical protein BASA62_000047 [Batrachochytrium salamandrivorans]KAH6570212.1 hypothetical protein BASA60_007816 [Batrachochytrium salamandrivorans]KAH6573423.1 hypothetical protein BASA62_002950 [Batrachochytrium salamandrivorans]KAH6587729.1 hypothetical protein BASA50_011333 [Batrachochytrium salamandrivorans]KAH6602224.1 hypothetical protein BASA61_001282 [Batrachochytrium salamandrivorans]